MAFFTDGCPGHGDLNISTIYARATYFFASKDHKCRFESELNVYVPRCGAYCAFGVAAGAMFPVDIKTWQRRDGKPYLNLNPGILEQFSKKFDAQVGKAERNWPDLVGRYNE